MSSTEEKTTFSRAVYKRAKELEKIHGRPFTVVCSGHTSDTVEAQAEELTAVYGAGADALILITNRLDINNEGDDVWIANAEKLLSLLPKEAKLGLYECPLPYKRLVTPKILKWCLSTDRFYFMKDTCCDKMMIRERLEVLKGSHFALMNANAQTLLDSLRHGASGYSSVMGNLHPELYVWLCDNYALQPEKAEVMQNFLGTLAFTETGLPYPLSAKYNMCLEGIPTENISRVRDGKDLTDYMKDSISQMRELCKAFAKMLGI
jgi:4-hydroxy-tetrahydrodipicolinate synthase